MKAFNGLSTTCFLPVEKAAPSLSGRGPLVVTGIVSLLSLLVVMSLVPAVVSAQVVWTQVLDASSKPATPVELVEGANYAVKIVVFHWELAA